MITRSNRTTNNSNHIFALTSRTFLLTAIAAAVLNSASYAQTNSSSGINRRSAEQAAKTPTTARRGTAPSTARAKATVRQAAKP
ncbi:MAG: hypothetical protein V4671_13360, partial [Armatimonadota bacterium]